MLDVPCLHWQRIPGSWRNLDISRHLGDVFLKNQPERFITQRVAGGQEHAI